MNKKRVSDYFDIAANALLLRYDIMEKLIPATKPLNTDEPTKKGSYHSAEEGRFLENVLREFLNKHLPKSLKALSGFILNKNKDEADNYTHSSQLDIIIYDVDNYPVFEQFEEFAIVPPEGVIGVISVKKNLYSGQISDEIINLAKASYLCKDNEFANGIFTGLISFSTGTNNLDSKTVINKLKNKKDFCFLALPEMISSIDSFSIYKKPVRKKFVPNENVKIKEVTYFSIKHENEEERNLPLQMLFRSILVRFYERNKMQIADFYNVGTKEKAISTIDIGFSRFEFPPKFIIK